MNKLILKLHEVLNLIKGFTTMYSTKSMNKMVIECDGKYYLVKIEEVGDVSCGTINDMSGYLD